jgi:hypothetical protein
VAVDLGRLQDPFGTVRLDHGATGPEEGATTDIQHSTVIPALPRGLVLEGEVDELLAEVVLSDNLDLSAE